MPRTPDHGQRVCEACGVRGVGVASPFPRMCDSCGFEFVARLRARHKMTDYELCEACRARNVDLPGLRLCDACQHRLHEADDQDVWNIAASDDRETQRELDWLRREGYIK